MNSSYAFDCRMSLGMLYIPVVQDCVGGARAGWEQIPEAGRRPSDYPFIAPALRLTPRNP